MAATSTLLAVAPARPSRAHARSRAAQDAHEDEGGHAEQEAAGGRCDGGRHGHDRGSLDRSRLGQDREGPNFCLVLVLGLGKGGGVWHRASVAGNAGVAVPGFIAHSGRS